MGFDDEVQSFLDGHLRIREGESRRRLEEGLGKAEMTFLQQVWCKQRIRSYRLSEGVRSPFV